jgi:hypothetical protein
VREAAEAAIAAMLATAAFAAPAPVRAEPPSAPPAEARSAREDLAHDLMLDSTVTAAGGLGWILSEVFKDALAPASCRFCDRAADGADSLNGFDRTAREGLRWSNPSAANVASNVTGFALAPTGCAARLSWCSRALARPARPRWSMTGSSHLG